MGKPVLILFILIYLFKVVSPVAQVAKAYCFKDGTTYRMQFTIVKNDDTIGVVYGVDVVDQAIEHVEKCSTSTTGTYAPAEITGDGSANTPYDATVNVVAGVASITCGHKSVGETYTWMFRTGLAALLQKPADKLYSIQCPFGTIQDNLVAVASVTVTGDLDPTVVNVVDESIALSLVNDNNQAISNAAIGASAKLQLTLAPNNGAKGAYTHSCIAGDKVDFTGQTYTLTDVNGCKQTTLFTYGFKGVDAAGATSRTDPFEVFRFDSGNTVHFRCRINYCYGDTDAACADFCLSTQSGRRKRSVERKKPDLIIASYVVTDIPHHILVSDTDSTPSRRKCLTDVGIVVGFCLLGVLVSASTATAIFMFYRLRLLDSSRTKTLGFS